MNDLIWRGLNLAISDLNRQFRQIFSSPKIFPNKKIRIFKGLKIELNCILQLFRNLRFKIITNFFFHLSLSITINYIDFFPVFFFFCLSIDLNTPYGNDFQQDILKPSKVTIFLKYYIMFILLCVKEESFFPSKMTTYILLVLRNVFPVRFVWNKSHFFNYAKYQSSKNYFSAKSTKACVNC